MAVPIETLASLATVLVAFAAMHVWLRREIRDSRLDLKTGIAHLDQRMSRLEDRVDVLDDRLYQLATGMKPLIEDTQAKR